jgi:hypothetical protein
LEQYVEKKACSVVLTVPLLWNGEAKRLEKEFSREKWDGERQTSQHGYKWIVVMQQSVANVKCVKCQGMSEI